MKPLVSILCITYNHSKFIRQTLDSFLGQKVDFPIEIIVHDDASTDGTTEILREYAKKYPGIIYPVYEKKNQYSLHEFKFINDMYVNARGKYIATCEGDDYWTDPNKLQLQVDFLEKNKDYALCFHPTRVVFETGEETETIWPKVTDRTKLTVKELLKENFIPSHSTVYRRQKYEKLPVGVMPGDWYTHLFHAQFGKIGFIDRVMSVYRRHEGGVWWNSSKDQEKFWDQYGMSVMTLHSELLKIYGNNKDHKQIISKAAAEALNGLVRADEKFDHSRVKQAIKGMPDIVDSGITYQRQQSDLLQQKIKEIETLNAEVLELRATTFALRDEVRSLRNSRVVGRVIKARDRIGNPYTLPKRSINKARRTAAQYVPDSIRLPLMKNLRKTRDYAKGKVKKYRHKNISYVRVENSKWKKGDPLVSVVIPFYNRADTIDETLYSLEKQIFKNTEIIIVDDCSPDKASIKKLEELENKSGVKVLRQDTNQGVAMARNRGIAEAKGKYIICLDSDDLLESTYIEKAVIVLEADPDISLVSTYQDMFGVMDELFEKPEYDPLRLYEDNMVITASLFRREAWEVSGGYKPNIGYEDWEYWLTLAENGHWGKQLPEPLFKYRTSMQSRYVEDKDVHWNNIKVIHELHSAYRKKVRSLLATKGLRRHVVSPESAFVNLNNADDYVSNHDKPNVLIAMPWMTFGGAETLIYNFCRETKDAYNVSFVTGLKSKNEWDYKFREISDRIYHLPNLLNDPALYFEFVSNLVKTRAIDVLHIVHTDFVFEMLPELKKRFPHLRIIVTMFNDRVPNYVSGTIRHQDHIDIMTSDNQRTINSFKEKLGDSVRFSVIPNGIDCVSDFSTTLYDHKEERAKLKLADDDLSVFFVGRLSSEKNPDVFVEAASRVLEDSGGKKVKFFIIGDGAMRPDIEKQLKKLDSANITYLGYQSEVARYLSAADVFVLPSSIEGFPLSILEAMSMHVVVIASNVGAIPDIIEPGENGFIIKPGSVDGIAEIVLDLNSNRPQLERIKKTGRKVVESKYSHTELGRNYRALYKDVL